MSLNCTHFEPENYNTNALEVFVDNYVIICTYCKKNIVKKNLDYH